LAGELTVNEALSVGGSTVSAAVRVTLPYDAEIVTAVVATTLLVITVKVVVDRPAGTITADGTRAALELLLDRVTNTPPAGAADVNDSVACGSA
jgi:hypothetical protein